MRHKLARMFRKDDAALDSLFSGKVVMLAKDLEPDRADIAIGKLRSCGAVVYLLDGDGQPVVGRLGVGSPEAGSRETA